ncbi:MAG: hypothetical protein LBG58_15440 [Planctomycetaceae bacterium]|jgi:hypothetical protein|nr:hypothetical protein [Planctomycetaceae bacterium]
MSNPTISLTYEQVMNAMYEGNKETRKIIQDFVKNTDRAIEKVTGRIEEIEKQRKEAEKQRKETEKDLKEMRQSTKELQQFTKELHQSTQELQQSTKELQQSSKELHQSTQELQLSSQEMQQALKNLSKQMGILGNRFGEVAEHMVFPAVVARFNELGYHFHKEFEGNFKVINQKNQIIAEIDAYLENDTTIAVVEIKAKPDKEDVEDHIQRIEKLKQNRQEFNEPPKIIIGAIAGAVFPEKIKTVAIKAGFYVLVQSGDTMKFDIPQNFKPREF